MGGGSSRSELSKGAFLFGGGKSADHLRAEIPTDNGGGLVWT